MKRRKDLDWVCIRFVEEYPLPNGSRHRPGTVRHELAHLAAKFYAGGYAVFVDNPGPNAEEIDVPECVLPYLAEDDAQPDDELEDMTNAELRDLLDERGLSKSGAKAELIARLRGGDEEE